MSDPYAAQPPASPPPPPSRPPGAGRPSRAPWLVAVTAAVLALAAVVALVVVLAGGDDDGDRDSDRGADGGSERGFDSPEEAVTFLVDRLADGEAGEAAGAFAVESVVEGYSFEAQAERLRAVTFTSWLPAASDGYDEINEDVRRGEVAVELRSMVRSVLAPERDYSAPMALDDDLTAEDLAGELSPEPLSELSVARVDELDRTDEGYLETLEQQAAIYGADELRMVAMLLDSADGQLMGGATVVRYGDDWAVMSLSAPLLNIALTQVVVPATEQDYLDAVESARGED